MSFGKKDVCVRGLTFPDNTVTRLSVGAEHSHVVVLAAPAPEFVREPVDSLHLIASQCAHTAEDILVRQPGRDRKKMRDEK